MPWQWDGEHPILFLTPPTMSDLGSPVHPSSDRNGTTTEEMFSTLRQKYDELVRKSGKRRRSSDNPTVEERARGIRKLASLYTNISTLAAVALAQEEEGDVDSGPDETVPEDEQRRHKIE